MHQLAMQTVESAREQPITMLQTEVEYVDNSALKCELL